MHYFTPRKLAELLGSGRHGTLDHMAQVRTGWALLVLSPILLVILACTIGADRDEVREVFSHPVIAILTGLFLFISMRHFMLGMCNVLNDYTTGATRAALNLLSGGIAYLTIGAGLFALATLAL